MAGLHIGGFHALALPEPEEPAGLLAAWGVRERRQTWRNASSAFTALLAQLPALAGRRIWLPAVVCPVLAQVVTEMPECGTLAFYAQDEQGAPDTERLLPELVKGDLVLVVSPLGAPTPVACVQALCARNGVWTVEDCAQAMDTGQPAWADWRFYSPRKLLGVPDGGLLVPHSERAQALMPASVAGQPDEAALMDALRPALLRYEQGSAATLARAFHAHQAREAAEMLGPQAMSRLSWALLALADPKALGAQRRANHGSLSRRLPAAARWLPETVAHVPLGVPVRVPAHRRQAIRSHMHRHGVFTAVYWPELPSPAMAFAREHQRAASTLVLPCDPRYGDRDMMRVAEVFDDACRRAV